jgi:hypothetical protein
VSWNSLEIFALVRFDELLYSFEHRCNHGLSIISPRFERRRRKAPFLPKMSGCFQVNAQDNVATMLDDGAAFVEVLGVNPRRLILADQIALGHKVALRDIQAGEPVVKFGVAIGRASRDIRTGQWVHLHNCSSNFDERSQTLDVHSGATTDTRYE